MKGRVWAYAGLVAAVAAVAAVVFSWKSGGFGGGGQADDDAADGAGPEGSAASAPEPALGRARLEARDLPRVPSGSIRLRLVDGDTRLPVPGAPIAIEGVAGSGKPVRVSGATDADGNGFVAKVAVGEAYAVRVSPPGGRAIERREVTVREDDITDLGTLYTAAHGVIEGVVVDEKGAPLPKVTVGATMDPTTLKAYDNDPFPRPAGFATPIESVNSDEAGAFRFDSLPLGMAALRADLDGYRTSIDRALIEKKAEPTRVRMVLSRAMVFRGRVEDGEGKGLAHAVVEIGAADRGGFAVRVTVETGKDGEFEVPGFAADPRFEPGVRVTAPDRTPVYFERVGFVDGFVRLILRGGARLEITVVDEWRETPVADALVTQQRPYDWVEHVGVGRYETTTDGRGRAVLDLPPGYPVRPWVAAHGYLSAGIVAPHGTAEGSHLRYAGDVALPLTAGETRTLKLWIRHGPLVTGTVRDAGGALLARARVRAEYVGGKRSPTVTTDGAGEYRMTDVDVVSRPAIVALSDDGLMEAREKLPAVWRDEEQFIRIDLRLAPRAEPSTSEEPMSVSARRPSSFPKATVRGRVLDSSHAALADALIVGGRQRARSDNQGEFTIAGVPVVEPRPGAGKFVFLSVSLDGYFATFLQLPAEDGDVLDARDVVLGFGLSIRGVVKGLNGKPVPFPEVRIPGFGGAIRSTVGREDGTFEIRGLAAEQFDVEARGRGYVSRNSARADLSRPGAQPTIEIVVVPQIVVEGRVEDETGAAVANASVWFDPGHAGDGPDGVWTMQSDLSGRFRLVTIATSYTSIRANSRDSWVASAAIPPLGTFLKIVLKSKDGKGLR